jgi:cardiolipin hydrolase
MAASMNPDEIDLTLRQSWEDERFTRAERRELREQLALEKTTEEERQFWRHRAFALAEREIESPDDKRVLAWLEGVIKALQPPPAHTPHFEASFSPGDTCRGRILHYLAQSKKQVDICVFTITDDRITEGIIEAHRRGIRVRIISDNTKAGDRGSDVEKFERAQVPVRLDTSPHHMHHKYALFDDGYLLTGSFNWTRSASKNNAENIVITNETSLVRAFSTHFDRLWSSLAP